MVLLSESRLRSLLNAIPSFLEPWREYEANEKEYEDRTAMPKAKDPSEGFQIARAVFRGTEPVDMSPAAAEEERLINEALTFVPPEQRAQFRAQLAAKYHIASTSNEQLSAIIEKIYELRDQRAAEQRRLASVAEAAHTNVKVMIALLDATDPTPLSQPYTVVGSRIPLTSSCFVATRQQPHSRRRSTRLRHPESALAMS